MMRYGVVGKVLAGDMLAVDNGYTIVRISNVWAPDVSDPLGAELRNLTEEMLLGKQIRYVPTGHIHYDNVSIVSEVYLDKTWMNQLLRYWLTERLPHYSPVLKEEGSGSAQS